MRCRNAKLWLAAQRDGDLEEPQATMLQNHLKHCPACRAYEQHLQSLYILLLSPKPPPRSYASISTDRILRAVEQQKRISRQLEDIRTQQQSRIARLRDIVLPMAALSFFTLGSIPLLMFALTIVQPDLMVKTLAWLSDTVDILIVLSQYVQSGLTLVTRDNRVLLGVAFIIVVMMGMWLRLMRYPQAT